MKRERERVCVCVYMCVHLWGWKDQGRHAQIQATNNNKNDNNNNKHFLYSCTLANPKGLSLLFTLFLSIFLCFTFLLASLFLGLVYFIWFCYFYLVGILIVVNLWYASIWSLRWWDWILLFSIVGGWNNGVSWVG